MPDLDTLQAIVTHRYDVMTHYVRFAARRIRRRGAAVAPRHTVWS